MPRISCPLCRRKTLARPAGVAAFMRARCGIAETETQIRYCVTCDFAFYERGLSAQETNRLYRGYRGEGYTAQRISIEPRYADYLAELAHFETDYYQQRRDAYHTAIGAVFADAKRGLDFGGDGHFLRTLAPKADIISFDIARSDRKPGGDFDAIFASNVLEHLSNPVQAGRRLARMLAPGGRLFVDVPMEYDESLHADFEAAVASVSVVANMHEHLNYFSPLALDVWASRCGFERLATVTMSATQWRLIGVLCAHAPQSRQDTQANDGDEA